MEKTGLIGRIRLFQDLDAADVNRLAEVPVEEVLPIGVRELPVWSALGP